MIDIVIYAPSYDANIGGSIVLHKLCDALNSSGKCRASLFPFLSGSGRHYSIKKNRKNPGGVRAKLRRALSGAWFRAVLKLKCAIRSQRFKTNPGWNTPIFDFDLFGQTDPFEGKVVVYPEIVSGNPLQARQVVRWLLHNPGFHSQEVHFGVNELHFRFSHETVPAIIPGSFVSDLVLTIVHVPWEFYNMNDVPAERRGVAYSLRKGAYKPLVHDVENSTLIDGKTHAEVASIFKNSQLFISYDSRSMYSQLASLCGCDSVIVPDPGVSEADFFKSTESAYGIAYGFEGIEAARNSRDLLLEQFKRLEANNLNKACEFLEEVRSFFQIDRVPGDAGA